MEKINHPWSQKTSEQLGEKFYNICIRQSAYFLNIKRGS